MKKVYYIWIKGCNVLEFGCEVVDICDGLVYVSLIMNFFINYDFGIYLEWSGIVVIEECEVYSLNLGVNSW